MRRLASVVARLDLTNFPLRIVLGTTDSMSGPDTSLTVTMHVIDRDSAANREFTMTHWPGDHDLDTWTDLRIITWIRDCVAQIVVHELTESILCRDACGSVLARPIDLHEGEASASCVPPHSKDAL